MSNFLDWLKTSKYLKSDNICGDLANDILRDKNFPDTDDEEHLIRYVEFQLAMHSHREDIKEFKKIYKSFSKTITK